VLRWLVVFGLSLASSVAAAQTQPFPHPTTALARPAPLRHASAGRFAHAASIVGVVSAGLLFGGSIAIAVVDDPDSEQVTRGVHLGYTVLAAPFVAFGAYHARRRAALAGKSSLRNLGWIAYTGAVAMGVAQWYGAFHDTPASRGLTIAGGAVAALSVLPHAFDAYLCARHARLRDLGLSLSAFGISGTF
jgi:hypothetical protein